VAGTGIDFAYLPVNADAVARAKPLADGAPADATGLYVYAYADGRVHARMFAAGAGVTEDPATGSAALGLGVHLVATGRANGDGRTSFTVSQGAEVGRPSTLHCEVQAAGGVATGCRVSGGVVPVASGRITASPG
jgi:trans-2,3-dihydro-3-hydroxyanthranilate isomerase